MIYPEIETIIDEVIECEREALSKLSRDIHQNPELRFEEYKAAAWIADFLRQRGFKVEQGVAGMPTAIRARCGNPNGPCVAILAEYDALPGVGHACGHNLIATGAVAAFLGVSAVIEKTKGEILLLGTPAEEGGGGGKIKMIEAGCFEGIAVAMMFHPFDRDILAQPSLANTWLIMTFKGLPAHAAAAPHDGKSALQACMDTFRLIDGQRVHFRDGVRVHGYITNGGQAVNIIPELAACEFSVRARTVSEMERVMSIVERCAHAAAMAGDVVVEITTRRGYSDMRNNLTLARRFGFHFEALGRKPIETDLRVGSVSTDMGNVSHIVPSIHPFIAIVDEGEALCHQPKFEVAAGSTRGFNSALVAARSMARTAFDIITNKPFIQAVKMEWLESKDL